MNKIRQTRHICVLHGKGNLTTVREHTVNLKSQLHNFDNCLIILRFGQINEARLLPDL